MLVTPRPGTNRDNLFQTLRQVHTDVSNVYTAHQGTAHDWLMAYLSWANDAVRMLHSQISEQDVNRLVLTPRYKALLGSVGQMEAPAYQRVLNGLLSLELHQRVDAFEAAVKALQGQINRWQQGATYVVADTSFYMTSPLTFDQLDLAEAVGVHTRPLHLVVPLVVVDELDSLKKSKDGALRGRARVTLAVIDRLFSSVSYPTLIHRGATSPEGSMTWDVKAELLFDPPGHVRLPINDDEIVDRAVSIEPLTGGKVALLTYDTGQATRGRALGLDVVKLKDPDKDGQAGRPAK